MPAPDEPGRRSSDDVVAARKREVMDLIANGQLTTAAKQEIADRYGVTIRTVYNDRKKALQELAAAQSDDELEERRTQWFMDVANMRARAEAAGEYTAAAKLLDMQGRAMAVYEPQRVEVTGPAGQPLISHPDPETFKRLAAEVLAAQLGDSAKE